MTHNAKVVKIFTRKMENGENYKTFLRYYHELHSNEFYRCTFQYLSFIHSFIPFNISTSVNNFKFFMPSVVKISMAMKMLKTKV